MTAPMNLTDTRTPVFSIVANGFKEVAKEAFNAILMSLIVSMKNEKEELINLYQDIELDNDILLSEDLDNFYDALNNREKNAQNLFNMSKKHKNKSDIFMQFYIASDELYDTLAKVNYDLGTIESNLIKEGKLEYAS